MDLEFHYYITFIAAAHAGFSNEQAQRIAYSSQYVDNNLYTHRVFCPLHSTVYENEISATFSPFASQQVNKTLLCHHFLPGNGDDYYIVTPNSPLANQLLHQALHSKDPYLIGIAAHAYSDTWAHQNFKGFYDSHNAADNFTSNLIPAIGHAQFGIVPDCVAIRWQDPRTGRYIFNNIRFRDAALCLFDHFAAFNNLPNSTKSRNELSLQLRKLLGKTQDYFILRHEMTSRSRIKKYIAEAKIKYGYYLPYYDEDLWWEEAVEHRNMNYFWKCGNYCESNWYRFQEAVKKWKSMAWQEINPEGNLSVGNYTENTCEAGAGNRSTYHTFIKLLGERSYIEHLRSELRENIGEYRK